MNAEMVPNTHFQTASILDAFKDFFQLIIGDFRTILSFALSIFIVVIFVLGIIILIIGTIQWATEWDPAAGKKKVVKGGVLIVLSLLFGLLGILLSFIGF